MNDNTKAAKLQVQSAGVSLPIFIGGKPGRRQTLSGVGDSFRLSRRADNSS